MVYVFKIKIQCSSFKTQNIKGRDGPFKEIFVREMKSNEK